MKRITCCAAALLLTGLSAAPAQAELYHDIAVGLSLFDFQFSGEKNLLGDGVTVNANAFYNNRRFNFGFADLTLTGALLLSADITHRGIPAVGFTASSGGSPLNYTFNMNNGVQDFTATGAALISMNSQINALGFYDQSYQISNRGTFATDGFGVVDSGTLDFDAGPIDIHGNIYADALAIITEPIFAATGTINPFVKYSAKATKALEAERKAEELRARIDAGEVLSDEEMASLVNNTILAAMLGGDPAKTSLDDLIAPEGLLKDRLSAQVRLLSLETLPEPSTLGLLAIALPLLRLRKPMR